MKPKPTDCEDLADRRVWHYKRLLKASGLSERALARAVWPDDPAGRSRLRNLGDGVPPSDTTIEALADHFGVDAGRFYSPRGAS